MSVRQWLVAGVALYAFGNLAASVGMALFQPSRAADLNTIHEWATAWLVRGEHLYSQGFAADYPPSAIVVFSPLAFIPIEWLVPAWAVIVLGFTLALPPLVVRAISPRTPLMSALVPMLLFLCWGGVRTLLQFTRFTLVLAFLGVILATSRPLAAGAALGLALAKPHIAGPVFLWTACMKRARVAITALVIAGLGVAAYCLRADVAPVPLVREYAEVLVSTYAGEEALVGRTSLRPWWHAVAGDHSLGDRLWIAGALVLLLVPVRIAVAARSAADRRASAALALFCLWSLLTIYHLGNNFVLALPAFLFLFLDDGPGDRRWRLSIASMMQIAFTFDIALHLPRVLAEHAVAATVAGEVDRLVVLTAFASIAATAWSRRACSRPR